MNAKTLDKLFQQIALNHLAIDTLETRHSDRLDFHEVSAWGIKSALQAAFDAGKQAACTAQQQHLKGDHHDYSDETHRHPKHRILAATQRTDGNIEPLPATLRGGARTKVIEGLLTRGYVKRRGKLYHLTDAGYAAVGAQSSAVCA